MLSQLSIKGEYFGRFFSFLNMAVKCGDAVVDCEFLRRRQNETVFKEMCVASAIASETFRFKSLYKIADHGSIESGINWMDGHIE